MTTPVPAPQGDIFPAVTNSQSEIYYRASSLGSCTRRLLAARLGHPPQPPPASLQVKFDEGHQLEPLILDKLKEAGWILNSFQREFDLHVGWNEAGQSLVVRGHVDAMGIPPFATKHMPVDAKAFSSGTLARFLAEGISAFPHYSYQQSAYALASGSEQFCLALYNKDTGELIPKVYHRLPVTYEDIQSKIFFVESLVDSGDPTSAPCTGDWGCPYAYLHDAKPVGTIPDEAMPLVQNYLTAKRKVDTYKKVMDVLKEQIMGHIEYTEDFRNFTSPIATIQISNNPSRFNTQKVKELLTEAGLDVAEYHTPGEGVRITIKER